MTKSENKPCYWFIIIVWTCVTLGSARLDCPATQLGVEVAEVDTDPRIRLCLRMEIVIRGVEMVTQGEFQPSGLIILYIS